MKRIDNEDDVDETRAGIAQDGGKTLKIPKGRTPVYILNSEFSDGYVHWVDVLGSPIRVVCGGGFEGKGWAVDDCSICKKVAGLYQKAKSLKKKEGPEGDGVTKLQKKAGRIKAKYEAHFLAAQGEMVKEKREGKKVSVPDFDNAKVGILTLTRQMYEDFTSLRDKEEYPFMHGAKDLTNRIIVLSKSTKEGSTYATTDFIPAKSPSDPPEVEYDADEFDLDEDFVIDEEQIEKVASALDDDDDEEEEDFEEEADEEETSPKNKKGKKAGKKSGDSAEADFLDDLEDDTEEADEEEEDETDEEEEEEENPKPKAGKKPAAKATSSKSAKAASSKASSKARR